MQNIHHAEMTHLVRREKELERNLNALRDEFATWKERVELAREAGRDELAEKAKGRIQSLRADARRIRSELKEIVDRKSELRKESKMPTGEENRRAQALLKSFKESGLVDPDEAQLQADIEEASKNDDAALNALKAKAGMEDEKKKSTDQASRAKKRPKGPRKQKKKASQKPPQANEETTASSQTPEPEENLDAELQALRQKMGDDTGGGDIDVDELEKMFSDDG